MNEDGMLGRVGRLETSVETLKTDNAGFKVQLQSVENGQSSILGTLAAVSDKLDRSRPGIGAIWTPLGVMVAILLAIGSLAAQPQIARVSRLELTADANLESIMLLRIDTAVQRQRSEDEDRASARR